MPFFEAPPGSQVLSWDLPPRISGISPQVSLGLVPTQRLANGLPASTNEKRNGQRCSYYLTERFATAGVEKGLIIATSLRRDRRQAHPCSRGPWSKQAYLVSHFWQRTKLFYSQFCRLRAFPTEYRAPPRVPAISAS